MNNYVCTAATAARLKAAGFPQPAPEIGQVWADERGRIFSLSKYAAEAMQVPGYAGFIYVPGVADLLRELGYDYSITYKKPDYIVHEVYHEYNRELARNDNPAEALAAAWLELHEKK